MAQSLKDKVVLITGASSGIGEALARELARRGARLCLCARRVDRLRALADECTAAGGESIAVACDVTRDGDLEAAVAQAKERFGRLDVAVANAGFGVTLRVDRLKLADFRRQFETNVFGVLRTVYATLDELKASKGSLVLVGSVASYLVLPTQAPYAMSKFAVRALGEALQGELAGDGVHVLLVSPGFVESEIRSVNRRGEPIPNARDPIPKWLQMPADVAARKIVDALAARRRERILTAHGHAGVFLSKHAPWVVRLAARRSARKIKKVTERHEP